MNTKDIKELHTKTIEELRKMLIDEELQITQLKIDLRTGKLKNTNAVKMEKKDVARILTVLGEKTALARINK